MEHSPEDIEGTMLVSPPLLAWELSETDPLAASELSENKEVEHLWQWSDKVLKVLIDAND